MSIKTLAAGLGAVVVLSMPAWLAPQAVLLEGQQLSNCRLEIEPIRPQQEAQVYYGDYQEPGANEYGVEYTVHVPKDGLLQLADFHADVGQSVTLERDKEYKVRLFWDKDDNDSFFQVGIAQAPNPIAWGMRISTPHVGTFDQLGALSAPEYEEVRREVNNPNKKRLRIRMRNYGVELAFTLSDV